MKLMMSDSFVWKLAIKTLSIGWKKILNNITLENIPLFLLQFILPRFKFVDQIPTFGVNWIQILVQFSIDVMVLSMEFSRVGISKYDPVSNIGSKMFYKQILECT